MEKSQTLSTQLALAGRAGLSQSHLSEMLRGITSPTIDLVNDLAYALGIQPWELLADTDTTRQAALAHMLWGGNVSNEKVEQHYPPAPPSKEAAPPQPKKSRGPGGARKSAPPPIE